MTNLTTTEAIQVERIDEIVRLKAIFGENFSRIASAMGHPGYGEKYSFAAIARWVQDPSVSLHEVFIGPRR